MTEQQLGSGALTPECIVNTESAAHFLNLSAVTLSKWRVTGGGPRFLKFGRSIKYRVADLQEWMLEQQCASTAEYKAC